jgi:phage terminase small subunit
MTEAQMFEDSNQDKQPKAFELYKATNGELPLTKIAQQVGASPRTVQRWAKANNWKEQLTKENRSLQNLDIATEPDIYQEIISRDELVVSTQNLRLVLDCLNEKISKESETLSQMKLDDLLKIATNFSKAISEATKAIEDTKPLEIQEPKEDDIAWLHELIAKDPETLELANKLLQKLAGE